MGARRMCPSKVIWRAPRAMFVSGVGRCRASGLQRITRHVVPVPIPKATVARACKSMKSSTKVKQNKVKVKKNNKFKNEYVGVMNGLVRCE